MVECFDWDGSDYNEIDFEKLKKGMEGGNINEEEEDGADDEDQSLRLFGHGISILKTLDDNDDPFIELLFNAGDELEGGLPIRAIGKKQKEDGGSVPLTKREARRLKDDEAATFESEYYSSGESEDEDGVDEEATDGEEEVTPNAVGGSKKRKAEDDGYSLEPSNERVSKRLG